MDAKVLERARKLHALTESSNVNEAALAAAKLSELLVRHHIDRAHLEGEQVRPEQVIERKMDLGRGGNVTFRRALLSAVAQGNGCQTVFWTSSNDLAIVGHETAVGLTLEMYFWLRDQVIRLANEQYALYRADAKSDPMVMLGFSKIDTPKAWKHAFHMGAASTIGQRLRAAREGAQEEQSERALVRVADQEVEDKYNELHPNVKAAPARSVSSAAGLQDGFRAGKSMNLGNEGRVGRGNARALGAGK